MIKHKSTPPKKNLKPKIKLNIKKLNVKEYQNASCHLH